MKRASREPVNTGESLGWPSVHGGLPGSPADAIRTGGKVQKQGQTTSGSRFDIHLFSKLCFFLWMFLRMTGLKRNLVGN